MKLYTANARGTKALKNWRLYTRDHETGKPVKVVTMADMPSPELEHSTAETIAAAATACDGLELPPDIPAGAVAALVDAARATVASMTDRGPKIGHWRLDAALAPFKPLRNTANPEA